jgi:hypothetical protein
MLHSITGTAVVYGFRTHTWQLWLECVLSETVIEVDPISEEQSTLFGVIQPKARDYGDKAVCSRSTILSHCV